MLDVLLHKWLRVPYTLHIHVRRRPKRARATVLFIHGIGNSGAAWSDVIRQLPPDLHIISIDLLGFGKSPRPEWAIYSAKTQAHSIIATLLKLRTVGPVIIVGHSLGALVAVEVAKRYPLLVRSLILCSPPFYRAQQKELRAVLSGDNILKNLYTIAQKHPEQFIRLAELAVKMGLLNSTFSLTSEDAPIYMNALQSSIVNQTSLEDAVNLKVPAHILYGRLDPVVLLKNLRYLEKNNANFDVESILASHEVRGLFIPAVVNAIERATKDT